MDTELIYRHLQALAVHFVSYSGPLPALVEFAHHSLAVASPGKEALDLFIRKESNQKELATHWETALWKSSNGLYHLVCITPELDVEVARRRLNQFPTAPSQCRWCLADAKSHVDRDLVKETDIHGHPVHRSLLHRNCMRPWLQMRDLVEHADARERA